MCANENLKRNTLFPNLLLFILDFTFEFQVTLLENRKSSMNVWRQESGNEIKSFPDFYFIGLFVNMANILETCLLLFSVKDRPNACFLFMTPDCLYN